MNVVLEARAWPLAVNLDIAITNEEVALDELQAFPSQAGREKGAEVGSAVFPDAARDDGSGIGFIDGELYIRIGLVVPQEDVVLGFIPLDQVVFEGERFPFRIRHDELHVVDGIHHLVFAFIEIARELEVRPHAVSQRLGLPHVNRLARGVFVEVHAGSRRNSLELGFDGGVHREIRDVKVYQP